MRTAPLVILGLMVAPAAAQVAPPGAPAGPGSAASAVAAPPPPPGAAPEPAAAPPPAPDAAQAPGPAVAGPAPPPMVWQAAPPTAVSAPPAPAGPGADGGEAPTVPLSQQPLGRYQEHTQVTLGYRLTLVRDPGLDPFAHDDALSQATLGASHVVYTGGRWSAAAGLGWDAGGTRADARGQATSLTLHRVTATAEARYHFLHFLYGYARLGLGGLHTQVAVDETASGATLKSCGWTSGCSWTFAADGLLGISGQVLGVPDSASRRPRAWVFADGGYAWSPPVELSVAAAPGEGPERLARLDLGELALRGLTFRFGAAMSF